RACALLLRGEPPAQRRRGDRAQDLELRLAHPLRRYVVAADAGIERVEAGLAARPQVDGRDADRRAELVVLALGVQEPGLAAEDELAQAEGLADRALAAADLSD